MADLPQQLIDKLEQLVEEKFDELIKAHKINSTEIDEDVVTWENEQMVAFDGEEPIPHWFFRKFLAWLKVKIATVIVQVTEVTGITFDAIRYITPVDYEPAPDCGKIIAPFANLVIEGEDVEPTIPDPFNTTPDLAGFNQASDLMLGGLAYNKTDNKWYFRGKKIDLITVSGPNFGYLYNLAAVLDARNMANEGAHVALDNDWWDLMRYCSPGGSTFSNTGAPFLKDPNFWSPSSALNTYGFNARPGGTRYVSFSSVYTASWAEINANARWWCRALYDSEVQAGMINSSDVFTVPHNGTGGSNGGRSGASVRIVMDSTTKTHGQTGTYTGNDEKIYRTICIGTHEWVADNIVETKYRNGDNIPEVTGDQAWADLTTGARCSYNNDELNAIGDDIEVSGLVDSIMDLKEALHLGIVDISDLQTALDALVPKETGKGLSANDLTDELVTAIGDMTAHINIENIHLPPDGTTIIQDVDKLSVLPEGIHDMFSADAPLAIDSDGKITLVIDEATLAIVDGKLTVIGGGGEGGKLAFDAGTGILSVDPGGETSVDLSSLAAGEGVDLTDYVKKSGEADQTIEGNIHVTGEVEPWA